MAAPEPGKRGGDEIRAASALLELLGYTELDGIWRTREGLRLDGGRAEALDEASADVELGDVVAHPREEACDGAA